MKKAYKVKATLYMTIEIEARDEDDAVEKAHQIPYTDWRWTEFDVYDADCIGNNASDYFTQDERISLAKEYA